MMNVSLDAETGVSEVEDLCVVLTADAKIDDQNGRPQYIGIKRIWVTRNRTRLMTAFGRSMTISDIPHLPEISDEDLCGVLPDPRWTDPDTGVVHTKPLSAFSRITIKSGLLRSDVFNAAAAISVNTQIRDDAVLNAEPHSSGHKLIPWTTVRELRAQRLEVRKRLRFLITRNTSPLIMGTGFMKAVGSLYFTLTPYMNAADIQYIYDQKLGKDNFSDQDLFLGGGVSPHIPFSKLYVDDRLGRFAPPKSAQVASPLSDFRAFLLNEMHPSAHDPKFRDRFEEWVADWPASRESAYRWIRTWAGRLRKLQASRYKQEHNLASRIDALVLSHEPSVRHLRSAKSFFSKTEPFLQTAHVLSYAFSPIFNLDAQDLVTHVSASIFRIMPYINTEERDDQDPKTRIRIEAAGRILGNPKTTRAGCVETTHKLMLMAQLPEAWQSGVNHTLNAVRAGKTSLYDLLADSFEHPLGDEASLWEFVRKNPHMYQSHKSGKKADSAFPVYAGMEGMTPQDGGARLAFVRGKVAAWNILTSDETKIQLTLDEVITLVMNQVLF